MVDNEQFCVFLSYNGEDREIAQELARRLADEARVKVWLDVYELVPGQPWQPDLETALAASDACAVLIGPSGTSEWQKLEISCALVASKREPRFGVIPVLLPGAAAGAEASLSLFLSTLSWVDFRGPEGLHSDTQFHRLVAGIHGEALGHLDGDGTDALHDQETANIVLDYYRAQEATCEQIPLTVWHGDARVKASEVHVLMHLLIEGLEYHDSTDPGSSENPEADNSKDNANIAQSEAGTGSSNQSTKREESKRLGAARSDAAKTLKRESWEAVFRNNGLRLMFVGDAGSGKSFSLAQEVRKRLSKARNELETSGCWPSDLEIPILVRASALVESKQGRAADALLDSLSDLSLSSSPRFSKWWHRAFESEKGRRLFIVIDGLDEIPPGSHNRFRQLMRELDRLESANLVVSCRTMDLREREGWIGWVCRPAKIVKIAPLEEEQQTELIEGWLGEADPAREIICSHLKTNYAIRRLCRTPLILTSLCLLYATADEPEEVTYASIYEAVTKKLLKGDWRDECHRPEWARSHNEVRGEQTLKQRVNQISRIVWRLFETSPSQNRFTASEWGEAYDRAMSPAGIVQPDAQSLLDEMKLVGLLTTNDSNNKEYYSFAHRTMLEYFAAVGLVEQGPVWVKTLVKHMWCESEWDELIRFAASSADHPTKLLRGIAKETGATTTPTRPLELLTGFGALSALLCLIALLLIGAIATGLIHTSTTALNQETAYGRELARSFRATPIPELTRNPLWVINARLGDLKQFYTQTVQVLYSLHEPGTKGERFRWLTEWMEFLFPQFGWLLAIMSLGALLAWLAKATLYLRSFVKQDDIFRTGLRLQSEIIGLTNNVSSRDIRRIVRELLASEKIESQNIYGATDEGGIPENLLLLVGGNPQAREILIEHWLRLVNKRKRSLQRYTKNYRRILSVYAWILDAIRRKDRDALLVPDDIQKVWSLAEDLGPYGGSVARYLRNQMPTDMQRGLESRNIGLSEDQLRERLLSELNALLLHQSLFEPARFSHIALRFETIAFLRRDPIGDELIRLNRLLLEDAFPGRVRKLQNGWIRFASWWVWQFVKNTLLSRMDELGDLRPKSELSLALRGLSLLPDSAHRKVLVELLDEIATTRNCLARAAKTTISFTRLDILVAKALVKIEDPRDEDRLIGLAHRRRERNRYTPLAISELSQVSSRPGIEAAAMCLVEGWRDHDLLWRESEFLNVLTAQPHERVLTELVRISEDHQEIFQKVLVPWLQRLGSYETAKESLEMVASDMAHASLASAARHALDRSYERPWLDAPIWIEHCARKISQLVQEGEAVAAAKCLDESISSYYVDYGSNNVRQALDQVAAACDESVLDRWFEEHHGDTSLRFEGIGALGKLPNAKVVEQALIKRARSLDFGHIDAYGFGKKTSMLRALGELGTKEAEAILLDLLRRSRRLRGRIHRRLTDNSYDNGLFYALLIASLGKIESNDVRNEVVREARRPRTWEVCYVAARLLGEKDAPESLKLLLVGLSMRGSRRRWEREYGPEPDLLDLALRCGARISKVNYDGYYKYWVTSQSRKFRFVVKA